MLTRWSRNIFGHYVYLANLSILSPFIWNRKLDQMEISKSKNHIIRWKVLDVWHWIYFTLSFSLMAISLKFEQNIGIVDRIINTYFNGCIIWVAACQLCYVQKTGELVQYVNSLFKFDKGWAELFPDDRKSYRDKCLFFMLSFAPSGYVMPLLTTGLYVVKPCNTNYISTWILGLGTREDCHSAPLWQKLLFIPHEYLFMLHGWVTCYFMAFIIVLTQGCFLFWSQRLLEHAKKARTAKSAEKVLDVYRSLQILNLEYNDCCHSPLFPGYTFMLFGVSVVCAFSSLRFYGIIAMPSYLMFPMTNCCCLTPIVFVYGSASKSSTTFLEMPQVIERMIIRVNVLMKKNVVNVVSDMIEQSHFRKRARSLVPIRFHVGQFYYLERASLIAFLMVIIDQTVSLLFMY